MAGGVAVERLDRRRWRVTGRDGRRWLLRPLTPDDAPALQRAYALEDPADRVMRLFSSIPALTDRMATRLCTTDPDRDVALVLTPEDDPTMLVGGARLMRDPDGVGGGNGAEYAVSMASSLKGQGLGRVALETALQAGREIGLRHVWGSVKRRNAAMRALAAKLGMTEAPDPEDAGLVITRLALAPPET